MNNNAPGQGSGNNSKIQNFLEALRASQASNPLKNTQEGAINNPFVEYSAKKEAEKRRAEQFFRAREQEWNQLFSAKEKRESQRIEEIRQQLKTLAAQVKRLDKNLEKAVQTTVVETGVYHESYLEHIKSMIHLFSLKVNSANSWLEMYNSRSLKKGAYWGMAKSHGTSYTQNNERAVATSVG